MILSTIAVDDIAAAIQVAIAPIFLLVGTGSLLNVVTARLGRVVDRVRAIESLIEAGEDETLERRHVAELIALDRRMKFGNRAVYFCCVSAVLICFLVAFVFVADFFGAAAGLLVALLFMIVVVTLIIGLICFLMEVTIATNILRVRHELITGGRTAELLKASDKPIDR
tara:strand:+ start:29935 stop:30441 length:507 start_codon:yes stop_codon:yes gene_type:complete